MIIKNAKLAYRAQTVEDSAEGLYDVFIEGERIAAIRPSMDMDIPGAETLIDAEGRYLLPAFADSHFHLRNPGQDYKQTLDEAAKSLAKGGYAAFVAMANTKPVLDNVHDIRFLKEQFSKYPTGLFQVSSVTKGLNGRELVDFEELLAVTKIFSDDGRNVDDENVMREALRASERLGFLIMDHSEPETEMVIRNIGLVREVGGHLHFCHVSRKASMEAVIKAKDEGLKVTVEVTPHHLFRSKINYRVNPPFAEEEDRLFLLEAVKRGYVDYIGSDHAPHTPEDKEKGAPGICNIESCYSMVYTAFKEAGLGLAEIARLMSLNPSELLGLNLGLEAGKEASLVLVEEGRFIIEAEHYETRSKNTPFEGMEVKSRPVATVLKGEIAYLEY